MEGDDKSIVAKSSATLSNYFDVLTLQMESGAPLIDFTTALRDTLSQYYWDPLIEYSICSNLTLIILPARQTQIRVIIIMKNVQ